MSEWRAGAVAFLAGYAVMGLELSAVRLLAPRFGDSAPVWTNVIGVILVALAVGAWLGGVLAHVQHGWRRLSGVFAIAGLLITVVPLLAGPVGGWLVPSDLPLDSAMAALTRGSLAATLLLFAPPVTLIGCVTPMLVVAVAKGDAARIGRSTGLIAALSTLGSLVGTFATTHLLVPAIGSRATVWQCAAAIFVCSTLTWPRPWRVAAVLVPIALALVPLGPLKPPPTGQELLAEVESPYQYLEVLREPRDGASITMLKINEGLDSFHSVAIEGSAYTGGLYYDFHAVTPFLVRDGEVPAPLRILSLGSAAGTFRRMFAAAFPGCTVDEVEIDACVTALGNAFFGAAAGRGEVWPLDARLFVDHSTAQYDVVLVDAYERQVYVPAHVASREFFASVSDRLVPGGVVSVNSGGRNFDDPVVLAIGRTMAAVFGGALAFRVPSSRNFMLVARKSAAIDWRVLRTARADAPELARVLAEATFPGAWRPIEPGDPVLTDDRPLLDRLQETALARDLESQQPAVIAGDVDPERASALARTQLVDERDYEAALATVRSARHATPHLRLLAGDARWYLHDLAGARAEYLAVRTDDAELQDFAARKAAAAEEGLRPRLEAQHAGQRNGWIGLAVAVVLAACAWITAARARRA